MPTYGNLIHSMIICQINNSPNLPNLLGLSKNCLKIISMIFVLSLSLFFSVFSPSGTGV
jgi:hypothetical protein